jgi:hypothetical protein
MRRKEAIKLLGEFWEAMPDSEVIDESIYMLDMFIEWLWEVGYEICPREFVGIKSNEVDK